MPVPGAISVISSMATRHSLAAFAVAFELETKQAVAVVSIGGVDAARRIRAGEPFDVAVLAADAMQRLADEGFVDTATLTPVAASATALAVRAGFPRPCPTDAASLEQAVFGAETVAVSTGPSGVAVRKLLAGWGFGDSGGQSIIEAPAGVPVARLLADGRAVLGFQQLSELIGEPGIDVVGAVPASLLPLTIFSAGRCTRSAAERCASSFLAALSSPHFHAALRRHGLEPA